MAQSTMLLKITAPPMVLLGRQDPACTVAQATVLHRLIQHSSMHIIDDAAHLANIEKPDQFNASLRHFLDSAQ
jgi:3-oxoadipate enol-lactonase